MHRNEIRTSQQVIQRHRLDSHSLGGFCRQEGIVSQHFHLEILHQPGQPPADPTQSYDPQGVPGHIPRAQLVASLPLPLLEDGVGQLDLLDDGHQQRQGGFGDGEPSDGSVHHRNLPLGGKGHIHRIVPDPGPADDPQARAVFNDLPGNAAFGASGHQPDGPLQQGEHGGFVRRGRNLHRNHLLQDVDSYPIDGSDGYNAFRLHTEFVSLELGTTSGAPQEPDGPATPSG